MSTESLTRSPLLPLKSAIEHMLQVCPKITQTEEVTIFDALNRVVAKNITSTLSVPPSDNSAMDGYAFYCEDSLPQGTDFLLSGQSLAGNPFAGKLTHDKCVRITTGAILPAPFNTVMMQENIDIQGDKIVLKQSVTAGNSVRRAGEDIRCGETVLSLGKRLMPADLALLASLGIDKVCVFRKPKVAIIATGDELVEAGTSLEPGQIYESNSVALHGLLSYQGADILHYGIVKDDPKLIEDTLIDASKSADIVLSCGGVSVGDADYVKQVLSDIGQINFWKVAIKPGKPFAFGNIGQAIFCGLPGNPVSSYVTFEKLVVPLLTHMSSVKQETKHHITASCSETLIKRPGRADFQRGIAFQDEDGAWWVKPNGKQGSGIMTSIANANCYILLEQQQGNVAKGTKVKIELF
ncbi:molybdopterin molybdotransferase MoeA [Aliiglaciecola sp.]|nr:molybdopterin molybdotransferase MoeA [Aliiglaciecola sp.]